MPSPSAKKNSLLSIADIARHFGLAESTARYYCKRFAAHIPSTGEGRRRRYRPETLEVVALVLQAMRESRTASEVDELLSGAFPRNAEVSELPATRPSDAGERAGPEDRGEQEEEATAASALPAFRTGALSARRDLLPAASPAVLQLLERQTCALEGMLQVFLLLVERLPQPAPPASEDHAALQKEVRTLRTLLEACEKNQQADMEQIRNWIGKALRGRQQP